MKLMPKNGAIKCTRQHVPADNDITGDGQEERNDAQICNGVDCTVNDCAA